MFGMIALLAEVTQMKFFLTLWGSVSKNIRKDGYTIEQFSAMINKSKATLSKYENGAITIDIETLYDIAQALEIDLKCFIDYQPPVFHQDTSLPKNNYFNQSLAYMYYYDGRVRQDGAAPCCASPAPRIRRPSRLRCIWVSPPSPSRIAASISLPVR